MIKLEHNIASVPDPILQNIFLCTDNFGTLRVVCTKWRDLIDSESFLQSIECELSSVISPLELRKIYAEAGSLQKKITTLFQQVYPNEKKINTSINKLKEYFRMTMGWINFIQDATNANFFQKSSVLERFNYFEKERFVQLSRKKLGILEVPRKLCSYRSLKTLNLSGNNLSTLPPEFVQLDKLEYLYLNNNKFSQIPDDLHKLEKIRELYLDNNQILNADVSSFKSLQIISLENNPLQNFFPSSTIKAFSIKGTPLNAS